MIPDPAISRIVKTIALVAFAAAIVVDAGGCDASSQAPAGKRRIVSVGGAVTETVFALGAGDEVVATDTSSVYPDATLRLHFHDTRNTGLANAYAGVQAGVDILDASVGGIGGCPFAPGATGNIATEDLVYMLERAGFATGYDLDALIETAHWIGARLEKPNLSALSRAGAWPPRAR